MTKEKHSNQKLEQKSRAKLKTCFSGWIVNDIYQDFGLDMKIRFTESPSRIPSFQKIEEKLSEKEKYSFPETREVLPISCFVQLKASKEFDGEEVAKKSIDTDLIKTYRKSSLPVVLLLYEESSDNFYWEILQKFYDENIKKDLDWYNQESKQVEIPKENSFSADKDEESNPRELVKFANAIFRYRLKRVKKIHQRTKPGDGYAYLDSRDKVIQYYDNSVKSADSIIAAAFDKLESEEYSDKVVLKYLDNALETLEIHFNGDMFEVPQDGYGLLFDFEDVLLRGKKIALELEDQDLLERIEELQSIIWYKITTMEGLHFHNIEIEEDECRKFRIVRVDLNNNLPMPPQAWLEYENGESLDENLSAIAKNDSYQIVDWESSRPIERKCAEGEHNISDEDIRKRNRRELAAKNIECSNCGFSLDTLRTVFDECWFSVCDVCDSVGEDFEYYSEMDTEICEDCSGHY